MKCPICGTRLHHHSPHCSGCGYRMPVSVSVKPAVPPRRSARPRRGCFPGLMRFLVLTFLLPLLLTFIRGFLTGTLEEEVVQVSPAASVKPEPHAETTPIPSAVEGCFAISGGAVTFLPERREVGAVLTIPDTVDGETVNALDSGCFSGCTELTTIILPDTLTTIESEAFEGCSKLRGLYIPQGVKSIGENAFGGCVALEAICIPATVSSIADGTFDDCARLLYINYDGTFESWAALYDDFITPFTAVICTNGTYYHGVRE